MKRSLALVAVLIAALLPAAPAHADPVVVRGLPDELIESQFSCDGSPDGSIAFVSGPGSVPLGTGSLRLRADGDDQSGIIQQVDSLASISSWDVGMRSSAVEGLLVADVQTDSHHYQLLGQPGTGLGSWASVDALHTELQVLDVDTFEPTGETTTIAGWAALGHGDGAGWVGIFNAPCALGQAAPNDVWLDGWALATNGASVDPYDFEPAVTPDPVLTNAVSKKAIDKGESVTVSSKVTLGKEPLPGKTVSLFAKPKGASNFSKVGEDKTSAKGVASLKLKPKRTTVYQWRYAGHTSPTEKVKVRR